MSLFYAGMAVAFAALMFIGSAMVRDPIGATLWAAAITIVVRAAIGEAKARRAVEEYLRELANEEEEDD